MNNETAIELALAIVEQAVDDWRHLCAGHKPEKDCHFRELEHFFENDCAAYLAGTGISAEKIYDKLKKERIQSEVA